MSDFAADNASG